MKKRMQFLFAATFFGGRRDVLEQWILCICDPFLRRASRYVGTKNSIYLGLLSTEGVAMCWNNEHYVFATPSSECVTMRWNKEFYLFGAAFYGGRRDMLEQKIRSIWDSFLRRDRDVLEQRMLCIWDAFLRRASRCVGTKNTTSMYLWLPSSEDVAMCWNKEYYVFGTPFCGGRHDVLEQRIQCFGTPKFKSQPSITEKTAQITPCKYKPNFLKTCHSMPRNRTHRRHILSTRTNASVRNWKFS